MATVYQAHIQRLPSASGFDPRHVEAYMRCEHGTLDSLSPSRFAAEVSVAVECIRQGGADMAESLAESFGL